MTGAVPCHEPEANETRSQPTPHRSNQSDTYLDHRLAEVDLGMARRMMQRHESLARQLLPGPDIVPHDDVAAGKPVLVP